MFTCLAAPNRPNHDEPDGARGVLQLRRVPQRRGGGHERRRRRRDEGVRAAVPGPARAEGG